MYRTTGWLSLPLLGLVTVGLCVRAADAAPVGTGTISAECDALGGNICCSVVAFDNVTYDVFGTPVNLGTAVGAAVTTNTVIVFTTPVSGTFDGDAAAPNPAVFSFHSSGDFICPDVTCSGPDSFIGVLTNIAGSFMLPPGLSYTEDGTASITGQGPPTIPGCPLVFTNRLFGPVAINAFQPANTPQSPSPGTPVTVTTSTTFFDSSTSTQVTVSVDVTYSNVSSPGTTVIVASSNSAAELSANFLADVGGYHAAFTDVSTTAAVTGPITVCSHYPDADNDGIIDGTSIAEADVRILHDEGGTFVDRTSSRDPLANVICATVNSFSLFVVAVLDSDADGIPDSSDNCPAVFNPDQADDGDGVGNACDTDVDNDGVVDASDNCPSASNPDQSDRDGDSQGDTCDNCPEDYNPAQSDGNGNGVGDLCETSTLTGFALERVRLRTDTSNLFGVDNGSIQVRGVVDATAFGNDLVASLAAGFTVGVTGAGLNAPQTLVFAKPRCVSLSTRRIICVGTRAETATFQRPRDGNQFTLTVAAPGRSFPPPLTTAGTEVVVSIAGLDRRDLIGSCRVFGNRVASCRK